MKADHDDPDERADDFSRGLENRRAVLGDAWVDKSLNGATDFNAEFQSLITRYAWHDIWGRPGLDHDTRRLLVLGMTMGLARWEEFELHCKAAIEHGVSTLKIKETLMQGAIYCGVPAANTAFKITGELLRAAGERLRRRGACRRAPHLQRTAVACHGAGRGATGGAEPRPRPRRAHVGRARGAACEDDDRAALRASRPR
jgi:4-carboxymuconolactone decarboxylase